MGLRSRWRWAAQNSDGSRLFLIDLSPKMIPGVRNEVGKCKDEIGFCRVFVNLETSFI